MGWVKGKQDWTIGGRAADADDHAGHDHAAMMAGAGPCTPCRAWRTIMPAGRRRFR
jgi:hypothetical protein